MMKKRQTIGRYRKYNKIKGNKMAKMIEETVIVTVSKLVKDNTEEQEMLPNDVLAAMEAVVAELIQDDSVLIEITRLAAK